jgi:predicted amidohydrolase
MEKKINDEEFFEKAYKKLKSNIYYDKSNHILRDRLVKFEAGKVTEADDTKELDNYLKELQDALKNNTDAWRNITNKILKSIRCRLLPKKIKEAEKENLIIKNFDSNSSINIEQTQAFIDMDIEGHILGMVWLMTIGWRLDKKLQCCYGNRIRTNLYNEFSGKISYSPYLFEPYFEKYESWRDKALELAKSCLNEEEDVLVMTLDFKRFYYSIDMTQEYMNNYIRTLIQSDDAIKEIEDIADRLNNFIFSVIKTYAKEYHKLYPNEPERNLLPIGFLPSNILANLVLKEFDTAIMNGWNPLYYGRYVDDILIVDKVSKGSDLHQKIHDNQLNVDQLLSYYLVQGNRWRGINTCSKSSAVLKRTDKENGNKRSYQVCSEYTSMLGPDTSIIVQNDKVKFFYFKSDESDALLTCFRESINKNKSEFRRMPEDDAVFQDDDYAEIFELKQNSINKFRDISGVKIDKYKLSKYLGKYLRICGLVDDSKESKFAMDIKKILTPREIIEQYTMWEKIITILLINNHIDAFGEIVNKIIKAINHIDVIESGDISKNVRDIQIKNLKDSLKQFLLSSISRAYSICLPMDLQNSFTHIARKTDLHCDEKDSYKKCNQLAIQYIVTRMSDKSMYVICPDIYIYAHMYKLLGKSEFKKSKFKCTNLQQMFGLLKEAFSSDSKPCLLQYIRKNKYYNKYYYYPYFITMYDLAITFQILDMAKGEIQPIKNLWDEIEGRYLIRNYKDKDSKVIKDFFKGKMPVEIRRTDDKGQPVVKVGIDKYTKIKVAISNIKMDEDNLKKCLINHPNRQYKRYQQVSSLVNEAIRLKANLLVMPEACVPIEWLCTMARTCAKNNLAVVTGVEHVVADKKVYNLTAVILPFESYDHRNALIVFHTKNYFAPAEVKMIKGYDFQAMQRQYSGTDAQYELYNWNDFWFSVYCCYELTSIIDRSLFQSYVDAIVAVEWNKDVNYYSNIMESLSRDMHCYCIQVNSSNYGDSRVTQPTKTDGKDILRTKGGDNESILVGTIDIAALREFQRKKIELQKEDKRFKTTPPQFDKTVTQKKIDGELFDDFRL